MGQSVEIRVPDIGDFEDVEVVELLVAKGDVVAFDDPLVSVESDKATMEIPSTAAGVVADLRVAEGDRVSEGSVLVVLEVDDATDATDAASAPVDASEPAAPEADDEHEAAVDREVQATPAASEPQSMADGEAGASSAADPERSMSRAARDPVPDREGVPHASPLVRRFARELGVPIEGAAGSGAHGRVLVDDVKQQVRDRFADQAAAGGTAVGGIPAMPPVDHASFGPVEALPLTRIQKVSGPGLHRSWLNVPHVTQHDEADVTELERFRKARRVEAADRGLALSPLLFVMKATVAVLREFPAFRASLAPEGDHLVVKNYYHLGIAVDTEQGLVVPVIRDVDRKGIYELAQEVSDTAERARARKLSPSDLSGACFTISSLGGIGGTAFSPIVNAPEVAILGLSRSRVQPVWDGPSPVDLDQAAGEVETPAPAAGAFRPRLILPFSLSYDHRVIDGAAAVRFTTRLAQVLSDPMQLLL